MSHVIVNIGLLDQPRLQVALELQKQRGGFFGRILVEEGWITEYQLCQMLSNILHLRWAHIDYILISQDVLKLVSRSVALIGNILPLFTQNSTLYLAMEDPCDLAMIKFIEDQSRMPVKPILAPVQQLRTMIRKYYYHMT